MVHNIGMILLTIKPKESFNIDSYSNPFIVVTNVSNIYGLFTEKLLERTFRYMDRRLEYKGKITPIITKFLNHNNWSIIDNKNFTDEEMSLIYEFMYETLTQDDINELYKDINNFFSDIEFTMTKIPW